MADLVGETLSHFRIVERLGEGGMGVVYKATDESLRRTVALKVLPEAFLKDDERRRRFLREARSAAAVTHANIAIVYEVGEVDGRVFLAMEYVEGKSLRKRLAEGPLSIAHTVRLARGILRGIAKAHEKGIIHRDLKPDNVLLNEDEEAKVLDFGLAKLREADELRAESAIERQETASQATQEGRVLGTPGYMSPEQAKGRGVDHRTDIFSFGVMLYEMLTGVRPFRGETTFEVLVAVSRDEPEPVTRLNPEVGPELAAIVDRCLAKSQEQRFASARDVLLALEAVSAGVETPGSRRTQPQSMPASTRSDVAVSTAKAPARKPRGRFLALLLVGTVVMCGRSVWKMRDLGGGHGGKGGSGASGDTHVPSAAPDKPGKTDDDDGTAITDHPAPKAANAEAAAAYASALQHVRDASLAGAAEDFIRAARLDPTLAAAHVRVVLYDTGVIGVSTAREHLAAASQFRGALDERDRALLDFAAATVAEPPDFDEMVRRIRSTAERFDEDAEVAYLLANALHSSGRRAEARVEAKRAHELDPHFAAALWVLAEVDQPTDPDAALATLGRCLELSPAAASCLRVRATIHAARGQCEELEADARRMTIVEPKGPRAYEFLALALASRGAAVEAVREALEKRIPLEPDQATSQKAKVEEALWTSLFVGDLTQSEAATRDLDKLAEGNLSESEHAKPLVYLLNILEERGDRAKMLDVVDAYDRRSGAWTHDDIVAPLLIAVVRRHAGRIDEAALARARAESERRIVELAPGAPPGNRWVIEYAALAEGPTEVAEALAALPDGGSPEIGTNDVFAGQLYLRGGQPERAVPFLERAAASCSLIPNEEAGFAVTIFSMRAHLMLGQAREQTGNKPGACDAYRFVLDRWKNAKPRSVTLDKAKERAKALACGA